MVIRGLAIREIELSDVLTILWKELRIGVLVGLGISLVNFARMVIMYPGKLMISLTVSLSLLCTVVVAKTIGGMLPLLAKALHLDPALMAAPLITTTVDVLSLMTYFAIASRLIAQL